MGRMAKSPLRFWKASSTAIGLQIEVPQLRGIGFREIGAQQVATLAPTSLSADEFIGLVTTEPIAERGLFFGELGPDTRRTGLSGARRRASSCTSQKH